MPRDPVRLHRTSHYASLGVDAVSAAKCSPNERKRSGSAAGGKLRSSHGDGLDAVDRMVAERTRALTQDGNVFGRDFDARFEYATPQKPKAAHYVTRHHACSTPDDKGYILSPARTPQPSTPRPASASRSSKKPTLPSPRQPHTAAPYGAHSLGSPSSASYPFGTAQRFRPPSDYAPAAFRITCSPFHYHTPTTSQTVRDIDRQRQLRHSRPDL